MSDEATANTKQASGSADQRVFLVVVDNSQEMRVALRFASRRAAHTGGRVALLYVTEPSDFQHWMAVGDLMREEARQEAEAVLQRLSDEVVRLGGSIPVLFVREGDRADELLKLIEEERSISIVVLAAGTGREGPGPIITNLLAKRAGQLHTPFTIVPGVLTDAEIDEIS